MCGIFGVIALSPDTPPHREPVEEGVRMLVHRGPDGSGVSTLGQTCFGHTRLAIIDLEGGAQPMLSQDGAAQITYNGEVYNFRELRKELEQAGHRFQTRSDTEVVLAAYREWGRDCVTRFRGMFAFAVVDTKKGTAFLARDRVGKKPLFYTVRDGRFFFASELEPLYRTVGPFRINMEALDDCLAWQYIPAPRTIYQDVLCLPPAHGMEIDLTSGKMTEECYWRLHFREDSSLNFEEWADVLEEKLRDAVAVRLVSDVPFGSFLSGGVDSSLVTGYMSEILSQPVHAFSIGFHEADHNELDYAAQVAEIVGADHVTRVVEAESISLLPKLVGHYGQPFADSSAVPTYYVSKLARKDVKMVLSGDGGDESFAGYNTYEAILRGARGDETAGRGGALNWARRFLGRLSGGARGSAGGLAALHARSYRHFTASERGSLYRPQYRDLAKAPLLGAHEILDRSDVPLISRLQHLDTLTYLPFDILTKVDIASMANSLEVRAPFVDHELMETAATIPTDFKMRVEERAEGAVYNKKRILKHLAMRRFPETLVERPKWGFGLPLGKWFAGKLRPQVEDRLLKSGTLEAFFDMGEVKDLLEAHSPQCDHSPRLWNLLFLEEWMRGHAEAFSNA